MITTDIEKLKYPIGKHQYTGTLSAGAKAECIKTIEMLPEKLRREIAHFSTAQLDTPYRSEGWTVRQLLHHFADSHMNAFIRFKMALTENKPVIKPYMEAAWAQGPDVLNGPLDLGLDLVTNLHQRWVLLLSSLSPQDLSRSYIHPEHGKEIALDEGVSMYAWHCDHHLAHITELKKRNNWH